MKFLRILVLLSLIYVSGMLFGVTQARAVVIDFESFAVGSNIGQVNTGISVLGAQLDAIFPGTFQVIVDPNNGANKVVRTQTHPSGADILINFNTPMNFVRASFINNPNGAFFTQMLGYNHNGTAANIQGSGGIVAGDNGNEPIQLQIAGAGIRAVHFESGSGFLYLDNIEFGVRNPNVVPEPATMALFGTGLLGAFVRRKRHS